MQNSFKIVTAKIILLIMMQAGVMAQMTPVIGLHKSVPNVVYLKNARIFSSPGKMVENGCLLVRDGKIEAIGSKINAPGDASVIDLKGKTIYPGFIDLFSSYGMDTNDKPKDKKTATKADHSEGALHWNPEVHPQTNATRKLSHNIKQAETLRSNGFTTVLTLPNEGIFRGSGGLVQLISDTPNKMILKPDFAQSLSFSKGSQTSAQGAYAYPRSSMGSISLIRQVFLDTQWYEQAWIKYNRSPVGQSTPPTDVALEALIPFLNKKKPVVLSVSNELEIFRAAKIAKEFNLDMWIMGCGSEYRRAADLKKLPIKLIIPLKFPEAPDVSSQESALSTNLRILRFWDAAPENPARLIKEKINFSISAYKIGKEKEFLQDLRLAVKRGLQKDEALKALTLTPAKWLDMSEQLGSLAKGKIANFFITDGDLFAEGTQVLETWVNGTKYPVLKLPEIDPRGKWAVTLTSDGVQDTATLHINGTSDKLKATISICSTKTKINQIYLNNGILNISLAADSSCYPGMTRLTGIVTEQQISGPGIWGDGTRLNWKANLIQPWQRRPEEKKPKSVQMTESPVVYPDGAFGIISTPQQPVSLLIKNATIWTSGMEGIIESADMLVKEGKIVKIGKDLSFPSNTKIINASGKHLTPGLIDAHAHIATDGGINESSQAVVAEVRIQDILDCDDINIYRQLAGGVTTVCTLHGSSNPIGGTYAVIKLRWGEMPDKMLIADAKDGIKFALGENVKQSNWSNPVARYPKTRMGVMEIIEDAFKAALDYRQEWADFKKKKNSNKNLIPPRRILRYEKILDILDGKTIIHCHSYRQDETLALMRLAEEIGFKIDVFIHLLEGYKVATELKAHGAMATTFSDWWTYKMEARDAIPYNGAIMYEQGIVVSYDSDSAELARRLNTEAAKAVKYGNVPPIEAIKFVTLNAAKQLYLEDRIGSLEPGKEADFAIWSESPFSTYAKCEQTWIDGRKYFDLKEDQQLREKAASERNQIIQKILNQVGEKKSTNSTD